ncbi:hypothetical protein ACOSQ3_006738 [Xanthoceras sorbifolium]
MHAYRNAVSYSVIDLMGSILYMHACLRAPEKSFLDTHPPILLKIMHAKLMSQLSHDALKLHKFSSNMRQSLILFYLKKNLPTNYRCHPYSSFFIDWFNDTVQMLSQHCHQSVHNLCCVCCYLNAIFIDQFICRHIRDQ